MAALSCDRRDQVDADYGPLTMIALAFGACLMAGALVYYQVSEGFCLMRRKRRR